MSETNLYETATPNATASTTYPMVPLGEILSKSEEWIQLDPEQTYKQVTVRMWGQGVVQRCEVAGVEVAASRMLVVHANQFIISRIDARNGASGLISEFLDGAIVTNDFPVFTPNPAKILPSFLSWMSKTLGFVDLCKAASEGTTNRIRLKEDRFLSMEIPLPPIAEQRRIVARVEELAGKVEEARGLRSESLKEAECLTERASSDILDTEEWDVQRLEAVLAESPRNGLSPQREVESGGKPMLRINAVSSSPTRYVDLSAHKLVDVSDDAAHPFTLQNGDVFIVRYNGDINRLAKAAIFKATDESDVVYPDKLMRLRADSNKILPDFLVYALGSRRVRAQVEELGITTAGQLGISCCVFKMC